MPARYDVFISYRRADTARVQLLRDELQRLGYRVFFDTQSIEGGDDWKARLQRAVRGSRALVLCWSESANDSPIVTFEYSCARALRKPVVPWLLDHTPLPVMLNQINGIKAEDPVQVAAALQKTLGWTLPRRRMFQSAVAALLVVAVFFGAARALRKPAPPPPPPPPPPWELQGTVTDRLTRLPIAGVEVDLSYADNKAASTKTDAHGHYDFHLPQPQPATALVVFAKDGYEGDKENVPTNKAFDTDLPQLAKTK